MTLSMLLILAIMSLGLGQAVLVRNSPETFAQAWTACAAQEFRGSRPHATRWDVLNLLGAGAYALWQDSVLAMVWMWVLFRLVEEGILALLLLRDAVRNLPQSGRKDKMAPSCTTQEKTL